MLGPERYRVQGPDIQYAFNNTTTIPPPPWKQDNDVTKINESPGVSGFVGFITVLIICGLALCLCKRCLRWRKQKAKSHALSLSSADAYADAWRDSEGAPGIYGGMESTEPLGTRGDVELQNFGKWDEF